MALQISEPNSKSIQVFAFIQAILRTETAHFKAKFKKHKSVVAFVQVRFRDCTANFRAKFKQCESVFAFMLVRFRALINLPISKPNSNIIKDFCFYTGEIQGST